MSSLRIGARYTRTANVCLLLVVSGCATIRKFSPVESHIIESRQLTQQAQADIHDKRWDDAEANLLTAIERCPQNDNAHRCLADVLWNQGAHRVAIAELSKAIELAGRADPGPLTKLGNMELAESDFAAALRHADEALQHDNRFADAWSLRGRVLRQQGDATTALACFFRSLSIRKDNPGTRIEIAKIYQTLGQPQRALAILDAAASSSQTKSEIQPEISFLRGLALRELDRPQDATRALVDARDQGFSHPEFYFQLADAQFAAGELRQARATASKAITVDDATNHRWFQDLLQRIDLAQRQAHDASWR